MIKVALAGNPNCGKTTLFNNLTGSKQHVGNWPGVTVDKKEGVYRKNKEIHILDLPGTYSLSPYSAEEIVAMETITGKNGEKPDVVVDIVDATSIERNLYLTLQIMETGVPMVLVLNMMDEVEAAGTKIDIAGLSAELGIDVIPMIARSGKGIEELIKAIENAKPAKKLDVFEEIRKVEEAAAKGSDEDKEEAEIQVADLRYKTIDRVVGKTVQKQKHQNSRVETKSDKIDKVLTNRILGIPLFLVIMYIMFACTFSENFLWLGINSPGMWLAGVVENVWGIIVDAIAGAISGASEWLQALIVDGILEGIGAVLGFMPLVLVLYLLMSILEDSGYMARVAFIMDRIFRRFGLSGRSFIPLLMGYGCGVPAIMATRTLEKEKDRKITATITTFMPCGAKMPIFAMFISTIFVDDNQTLINYSIYILAIIVAIIVSLLLNKFAYKSETSNFIMELPQYRIPTLKSVLIHGWEKVKGFGKKAGTIILLSTILIWALSSMNTGTFNGDNKEETGTVFCEADDSYLA
ncbi:MAG: ferrous iron transport protein B, partial [Wujia sp.]